MNNISNTLTLQSFPRNQGESNDNGRFKRGVASTPRGGVLYIPPGQYIADTIRIYKPIQLIGIGDVEITATEKNKDILIVEGSRSEVTYQLEKSVRRGERSITLTEEPHDLAIGDRIVLTDDTKTITNKMKEVNAEVHEIDSIDGKTVYFTDTIYLPKMPGSLNLYKMYPLDGVAVKNIGLRLPEGSTDGRGVYANYVCNLEMKNIRGSRMAGSLIQIRKGMHVTIEKFRNEKPQVTGGGQGYGVQFFAGNNFVTIRDGVTKYCRHSVDLDGAYNVLVENVVDIEGEGASFVLVHNGWGTDITFRSCRALNTKHTGFMVESQGYNGDGTYRQSHLYELYNYHIIDCEVQHKEGCATSHSGIFFSVPVKGVTIRGCRLTHSSGHQPQPGTYGIRMFPNNNQLMVDSCIIQGYNRGIALWVTDVDYKNTSMGNTIKLRDITIRECNYAIFIHQGQLRCVRLKEVYVDHIRKSIFQIGSKGTFHQFSIDGLYVTNSDQALYFTSKPKGYKGAPILGGITNIESTSNRRIKKDTNIRFW